MPAKKPTEHRRAVVVWLATDGTAKQADATALRVGRELLQSDWLEGYGLTAFCVTAHDCPTEDTVGDMIPEPKKGDR